METKRKKTNRVEQSVFLKYGFAPKGMRPDDVHGSYETLDFTTLEEAHIERHIVLPRSIALLHEGGLKAIGTPEWTAATGYSKPEPEEVARKYMVVTEDALGSAQELDKFISERNIGFVAQEEVKQQRAEEQIRVLTTAEAVPVEWSSLGDLQHADTFSPCPESRRSLQELDFDLSPLLDDKFSLDEWNRQMTGRGYSIYQKDPVVQNKCKLVYYYSDRYNIFIVLVLNEKLKLVNYFFVPPVKAVERQEVVEEGVYELFT